MSTLTFFLFLAGMLVTWVAAQIVAKRLTEGDKFLEETVGERLGHLEDRLYTHRRWWQTGIVVNALAIYVMVVGMFFVQNVAEEVDRGVREREQQIAEERIVNQCRFRSFVREFFDQLGRSQFNVGDISKLEGYDELDDGARLFVNSLAIAITEQSITVEQAREAYIETFPTDQC